MEFTEMQAQEAARSAGIDLEKERFDLKALTAGMNAELEHGTASPDTNITNDDPVMTAKLAAAHLRVSPFYYASGRGLKAWEASLRRGVKVKSSKTEHKTLSFRTEEYDEESGIFSGYAAVYGNIDSGGDIIEPGAFTKTIAEGWERVKILALHNDCWLPIGRPLELREDSNGLFIKAKISDTSMGRDIKVLLKDGVLTELSIGYDPIVFDYAGQDTALVEIKVNNGNPIGNDLIYGEIHGLKKDEDGNALGGALIGLFKADCTEFTRENAILTATSTEDGGFSFTDVPYGNWLVREIEAPTGFVLSDEPFAVTVDKDGAVIEVEIENTLIRGTVQLTKVDKDYPDHKLTGAEFVVYRDSNGNKELDADDELLGTLTETGTGVYEMPDLIYGGYFVKETKAPEGFYLDENAYYFEITENGKTVTVENEAGKGFVNAPQVGSLKIIKTSSDSKVEGFSFRVTGPNGYSEIFTTDKNGEILIENLRIGEYVISEVSDGASAAYILPADKTASVFEGAVTKVEMHNELRDTPKTGDDSNPALWLALLGISAVGAAALGVIGWKKKKTEKEDAE